MGLKSLIAGSKIGWRKRHYVGSEFSFSEELATSDSVLICLPEGLRELTIVKPFLPEFADIFAPAEMFLLASPGSHVANVFPRKGYRIIAPGMNQRTWAGLPKPGLLKTLHANKFNLIIDLNLRPNSFMQFVLLDFADCVKIGVGDYLGEPFHNVEIRTSYMRDERNIYRSFIETIHQLRNPLPRGFTGQTRLVGF